MDAHKKNSDRSTTALRMGPVKFIMPVLLSQDSDIQDVLPILTEHFGPVDFISRPYLFDITDYYQPEMGEALNRVILSFERLIPPEDIRECKILTNELEDVWRSQGNRAVNLDPGYIDYFKLVLASNKAGGNKVAVGKDVWLDINLLFVKKQWQILDWTFPDFKTGKYNADLSTIRNNYKKQMRELQD